MKMAGEQIGPILIASLGFLIQGSGYGGTSQEGCITKLSQEWQIPVRVWNESASRRDLPVLFARNLGLDKFEVGVHELPMSRRFSGSWHLGADFARISKTDQFYWPLFGGSDPHWLRGSMFKSQKKGAGFTVPKKWEWSESIFGAVRPTREGLLLYGEPQGERKKNGDLKEIVFVERTTTNGAIEWAPKWRYAIKDSVLGKEDEIIGIETNESHVIGVTNDRRVFVWEYGKEGEYGQPASMESIASGRSPYKDRVRVEDRQQRRAAFRTNRSAPGTFLVTAGPEVYEMKIQSPENTLATKAAYNVSDSLWKKMTTGATSDDKAPFFTTLALSEGKEGGWVAAAIEKWIVVWGLHQGQGQGQGSATVRPTQVYEIPTDDPRFRIHTLDASSDGSTIVVATSMGLWAISK